MFIDGWKIIQEPDKMSATAAHWLSVEFGHIPHKSSTEYPKFGAQVLTWFSHVLFI